MEGRASAYLIPIPVLEQAILPNTPEVVRAALESNLHHTPVVREQRLMAVAEVETPYLDVLVGGAGNDEFGVRRDVHGQNW